jgi:ABC-type transport system involved in cytochrome bd biosynthesis fused ATPase/permease subunit
MTNASQKPGRINWTNLVTVASAAILIGTMIVGLGLATGWAIAGALGLGEIGTYVIEALFVAVAAVVIVAFWRTASRVEPVVEH